MSSPTDARLFCSLLRASRAAFTKGSYKSAACALAAALYQAAEQSDAAGVEGAGSRPASAGSGVKTNGRERPRVARSREHAPPPTAFLVPALVTSFRPP